MKKNIKIKAFTLAEILLTLIIIGVVSALTVPTLKNHSDESTYVAATQKAMSEVAAAVANIETIHGDASTWDFNSSTTRNWFKNSMNIVPMPNNSNSWKHTGLSGEEKDFSAHFFTADGMAWSIGNCNYSCGGGCIIIDVNASQPPNTIGVDIHGFRIGHLCGGVDGKTKTGEFGIYAMGDGVNDTNASWACTSYIIKHKKMPWLFEHQDSCSGYMGK